jgi:hypothetical protein
MKIGAQEYPYNFLSSVKSAASADTLLNQMFAAPPGRTCRFPVPDFGWN